MVLRLRTRFSLTLFALALGPLAVTTSILVTLNLTRLRRSAKEYRLAVADAVAGRIRADLAQARTELRSVGAGLARTDLAPEERLRLATALLLGAERIDAVSLFDRHGRRVDTLRTREAPREDRSPQQLDEGTRGVARTEGVAYLGTVRTGRGAPRLPMVLPLLVGPKRILYGYVMTHLDLAPLRQELVRESRRRFDGEPGRLWIVDQRLRILVHADPHRVFESARQHGIFGDLDHPGKVLTMDVAISADYRANGEDLLGALQPLPELGWGIVVEQPRARAYAAIRTTVTTAATVGIGFGLLALALGLLLGRRLAAPITAVAEAAGQVARGDFSRRIQTRRRDEVGEMARAFNTMAEDLERFEARVVEESRIRTDLSRYLSADLVEGVMSQEIDLSLGGTRQPVAVLFADVVAFTPLVESREPEEVVAVLNELFTFLTEIVFRHGGIVDKFIGDSVMAVFGVPRPQDDAPLRALRAAEEMLRWLETGNVRWQKRLGRPLELAVGIHAGEAVVGNVGSERRMEYTVIGDTVNVAARLEAMARPGQVLLTEAVAAAADDEFDLEPLGEHTLAGKTEPVRLYALVDA